MVRAQALRGVQRTRRPMVWVGSLANDRMTDNVNLNQRPTASLPLSYCYNLFYVAVIASRIADASPTIVDL